MRLDVQYKLRNNPLYLNYLHYNSYWYKNLSRNPNMINKFIDEAKTNLELRPSDKISKVLSKFEMITSIFNSLK